MELCQYVSLADTFPLAVNTDDLPTADNSSIISLKHFWKKTLFDSNF